MLYGISYLKIQFNLIAIASQQELARSRDVILFARFNHLTSPRLRPSLGLEARLASGPKLGGNQPFPYSAGFSTDSGGT